MVAGLIAIGISANSGLQPRIDQTLGCFDSPCQVHAKFQGTARVHYERCVVDLRYRKTNV